MIGQEWFDKVHNRDPKEVENDDLRRQIAERDAEIAVRDKALEIMFGHVWCEICDMDCPNTANCVSGHIAQARKEMEEK